MKKILSLVLCLMMMLTVMSASAEVTPAGTYPITTEPITLKVGMGVNAKVEDIDTNQLTLFYEEKLGIDLEFVELNTADLATQINMLMTSGDLPDVFIGYNFPYDTLANYVDAGYLISIDELVEKYASQEGYYRFVNDCGIPNPEAYVTIDGSKYSLPTGSGMQTDMYAGFAARLQGKFLENLGIEMPDTLDEFYNYLVAVRDLDADGDGDPANEVPLTATTMGDMHLSIIRIIGNAFQYTDTKSFVTVKDGKCEFIANNDLYKETVLFIKKLIDEGLMEPAAFTQDEPTAQARHLENNYLAGAYTVGYHTTCMDSTSEAFKTLKVMPALEGPYGYKATAYMAPSVRRDSVITSACENPEIAFRFLDYLLTMEGSVAMRLGFEGSEWKKANEGELGRNGEQALFTLLKAQEWIQPTTNVIWDTNAGNFCDTMNYVYDGPDSNTGRLAQSIREAGLKNDVKNEYLPDLLISIDDAPEYNELKAMITDYVNQNTLLFVLGDRPMEDWDAYCAELEAMGVERYMELTQTYYDVMYK